MVFAGLHEILKVVKRGDLVWVFIIERNGGAAEKGLECFMNSELIDSIDK